MKTICFFGCFVLLVIGCEAPQGSSHLDATDSADVTISRVTGTNISLQPTAEDSQTSCEDFQQKVGSVDLNGELLTHQNLIAVPKNVHAFSGYLYAMPYSEDGDEMGFEQEFIWGVVSKKVAMITPRSENSNTVEVISLQDFFDTDGYEPQTIAGVCAIDPCDNKPTLMYPQPGCAGFTIVGLVNLEGAWLVQGSMFWEPFVTSFTQTGREVTATPLMADQSHAILEQNVLRFDANHYQYVCTLTSRTHCDGKRIDVQTGISVGWWVADKVVAKER